MTRDGAVMLSIVNFDKDFTTADFYSSNIATVKNESKDFAMIQESDLDINDVSTKCAIFSCDNGGIATTSIQVYFFRNKKGYIINGTSAGSRFNDYKSLYLSIIKSIRLRALAPLSYLSYRGLTLLLGSRLIG